jgi:hypothetical protein
LESYVNVVLTVPPEMLGAEQRIAVIADVGLGQQVADRLVGNAKTGNKNSLSLEDLRSSARLVLVASSAAGGVPKRDLTLDPHLCGAQQINLYPP